MMNMCYQVSPSISEKGLPVYTIDGGDGDRRTFMPLGGLRLKCYAFLNGSLQLMSADYGVRFFTKKPHDPSYRFPSLQLSNRSVKLNYDDLPSGKVTRVVKPGQMISKIEMQEGTLTCHLVSGGFSATDFVISYVWQGEKGATPPRIRFPINATSDLQNGRFGLESAVGDFGQFFCSARGDGVESKEDELTADLTSPLTIRLGYGPEADASDDCSDLQHRIADLDGFWEERLSRLNFREMSDEALAEAKWAAVHLASSSVWTGPAKLNRGTNGGMYLFNLNESRVAFPAGGSFRDGNQAAYSLAHYMPEIAHDQLLYTILAFKSELGVPQECHHSNELGFSYQTPGSIIKESGTDDIHESDGEDGPLICSSDQAYWWLLALTEYIDVTGDVAFLDKVVENADGDRFTVLEHARLILAFYDKRVGYGPNGLPLFLSGDWNDYLNAIGEEGRGESFFNVALLVLSFPRFANLIQSRDPKWAGDLLEKVELVRSAASKLIEGSMFPRAVTDSGELLGGTQSRLFMETRAWLSLAGFGTSEQRAAALKETIARCMTKVGPVIFTPPLRDQEIAKYSNNHNYPPGAGENGGVWWIVGYWLSMALEGEGLLKEAQEVYESCSIWNHHRKFPETFWSPFVAPDGISGPDSPYFGEAQQKAEGFNREHNVHEVAKYAYQIAAALGLKF